MSKGAGVAPTVASGRSLARAMARLGSSKHTRSLSFTHTRYLPRPGLLMAFHDTPSYLLTMAPYVHPSPSTRVAGTRTYPTPGGCSTLLECRGSPLTVGTKTDRSPNKSENRESPIVSVQKTRVRTHINPDRTHSIIRPDSGTEDLASFACQLCVIRHDATSRSWQQAC